MTVVAKRVSAAEAAQAVLDAIPEAIKKDPGEIIPAIIDNPVALLVLGDIAEAEEKTPPPAGSRNLRAVP